MRDAVSGLRRTWPGLACLILSVTADGQPLPPTPATDAPVTSQFIVLGTASGPNSEAARAQPANALVVGNQLYLVDAGDGAVQQLARAGLRLPAVRAVFLSHLHFDHTGGMLAVIGLRMQLEVRGPLSVFGPPGTQEFIEGLLAASRPAMRAGYGIPGQAWSADIAVMELADGDSLTIDGFQVTAAENTHFSLPDGDSSSAPSVSLSYRFDLADRSIAYTGDTGPSDAVAELARGADLLVSEMIDVDAVLASMRPPGARAQNPSDEAPTGFAWHMHAHHMTPRQVGELARMAQVRRLVVTHFAPNPAGPEDAQRYLDEIGESFEGDAELASDLGRY
jgi:ribonuclease BN (tRNA processing enzyme)